MKKHIYNTSCNNVTTKRQPLDQNNNFCCVKATVILKNAGALSCLKSDVQEL